MALDARLLDSASTGDTSYWRGLVKALSGLELDFGVLLYSNKPRPANAPDSDAFRWITVPAGSERWWSLVRFPLHARRSGARAIHVQYSGSPLCGRRLLTTVHDVSFFIGPEWFKPRDRFLLQRSVPATVRRAAKVFAVSETSKAEIEHFIPSSRGKVVVTPNALGDNISPMDRAEAERITVEELGLPQPYLLTVGTRWPRKNMALAVDAVNLLPTDLPHRLAVTGKPGWGEERLTGRTVATGYVTDRQLTALYQCASLYLAPSRHEGFGIPLLEAFACGCPVLSSHGGALPEVAGDAAVIEQSWEAADWSRRIQELLADSSKLESMRLRGYERVKQFSWTDSAKTTAAAYREVMSL